MSATAQICAVAPYILGTVQLGMPYGIANTSGQPDQQAATALVAAALEGGITSFDTAQGYGTSEQVLGCALQACHAPDTLAIITKLPPQLDVLVDRVCNEASTATAVDTLTHELGTMVSDSLHRLQRPRLACLMLHREEQLPLLDGPLGTALTRLLEQGLAACTGVSVYTPTAALAALQHPLMRIVQVPTSVLDRRFMDAGVFELADRLGKTVHIRSALLQGVVALEPQAVPAHLIDCLPGLASLHRLSKAEGISPVCAALGWVAHRCPHAHVLFGAETADQVQANLDFTRLWRRLPPTFWDALDAVAVPQRAELLNPGLWPAREG